MIKETIVNGFEVWKNNLLLGVPYLVENAITSLIFLICVMVVVFQITPSVTQELDKIQNLMDESNLTKEVKQKEYEKFKEILIKILNEVDENLNIIIGTAIVSFLATYAVVAYFRCVQIKYCLDAVKSAKNLKKAFLEVKNKWLRVYAYYLVMYGSIFCITAITFLFIVLPNYKGLNFFEYTKNEAISIFSFGLFSLLPIAVANATLPTTTNASSNAVILFIFYLLHFLIMLSI
ncbi:hypothetical protein DRO97_02220 [Archaeoglobales archaeon]|nr:MAG: hypothetical protein DRO97_02220 [Archaeoglobales archaeon]